MPDIPEQIDATVDGRCAGPNCGQVLTEQSASAHWCSPTCQAVWQLQQAGQPSPGSAPVRGSTTVAPDQARWRPELESNLADFDATGLELVQIEERGGFARRTYRWAGSDRWWFRLDDGHRFVGVDVAAEVVRKWEGRDQVWSRLERELADRRRLNPEPAAEPEPDGLRCPCGCGGPALSAAEVLAWMRPAGDVDRRIREAAETAQGERAVLSGRPDQRAQGTVFWLPNRPTNPEAPTMAELAGGVDLTPYRAPAGARPTFTWVDEVPEQAVREASGVVEFGPVVAGPAAETYRRAAQAESDLVALRAVCTDEGMYERAVAAARERGWSVRGMVVAVAVGAYTEEGWSDDPAR